MAVFILSPMRSSSTTRLRATADSRSAASAPRSAGKTCACFWFHSHSRSYTTLLCLLFGYPVGLPAFADEESAAALLSVFFIVPMWMNFLLRTMHGRCCSARSRTSSTPRQRCCSACFINFLPFMILPIYTTLIKLDRATSSRERSRRKPVHDVYQSRASFVHAGRGLRVTMVFIPSTTTFAISSCSAAARPCSTAI